VSSLSPSSCFLGEWYRPDVTSRTIEDLDAALHIAAEAMRAKGIQVRLLMTLAVPADEVLYAMFTAYSADSVVQTCKQAGIPVERLSSDVLLGSAEPPGGSPEAAHATG
jgi:(2Fe-2S) ferredoxin